jgi:putative transposase
VALAGSLGRRESPWQDGDAAFTVGATSHAGVRGDIANQESHHRQLSFREEWINLIERAGLPIDE